MASPSTETPVTTTTNSVSYSSEPKTPSFSSSPSDVTTKHDVFLSFHGKDTRYKFTSHLYEKLTAYGIKTYKDDPDLRIGEVISDSLIKAIHDSKIYIVVFSESYAYSPWCLDECVEIYKCYQEMNRLVVGVYCGIDPSVVRHQNKSFEEAFTKHKAGHFKDQLDKVNEWGVNLQKVSDFTGKHISAERSEADIINEVLDRIILEINPNTLYITKHPVGLESRVEDVKKMLRTETELEGGIMKIGIYGMHGAGKTTLAKSVYNQLSRESFKNCCFLANVREVSATRGLETLQKQLISDILKSKNPIEVNSVDHGIKLIEERLRNTKVLVVIDDLELQKQFDSLVHRFASGSIVIITTTDKKLLHTIKVKDNHQYKVNQLNEAESLALFNQHAFDHDTADQPSSNLVELSKVVLSHAGGLPLALEVFGSHLFGELEDGWIAYIEKLQIYSVHEIEKKLLISYNALEHVHGQLQDIFLDIACFFIGCEKETVVKILETYYPSSHYYIKVLEKRSLLSIDDRNQLQMHGLLVNMGKEIARNNSGHDEPGKHSRLWVSQDICNVLLTPIKGTDSIKGIIPNNFYYHDALEGVELPTTTFKNMSKLRFLYLKDVSLAGSFEHTFEDLRWFRWDCCPLKWLPSEFYAKKLVSFMLRGSKMTTLWEQSTWLPSEFYANKIVSFMLRGSKMTALWEQSTVPRNFEMLKSLDMSYSLHLTTTPDFSKLPCLETLNLEGCKSLEEIKISNGTLAKLVILNLRCCVNLRSLPDSICNLRVLQSLNIGGCSRLEMLPIELGKIESLTELTAWGLSVWNLEDCVGRLNNLVVLNISDTEYLDQTLVASALTSTDSTTKYDVFLSFYGNDTRKFTAHLNGALVCYGIRTFTVDPELLPKISLMDAIKDSQIYVVVFSENYVSSPRSLDELVEIYKCHKKHGRPIIPVFVNSTDPSVVAHQIESFKQAFQKHLTRFDKMEKVNMRRQALKQVANFPAYHTYNGSEADIIDEIVELVRQIIPKASNNDVKYSVGIDSRKEDIVAFLKRKTEGVIKFGIYGTGGVGKTKFAKALFDQLVQGSFKGSCFLENVGQISRTSNGTQSLQQQLVNDVCRSENIVKVHSIDHGKKLIAHRICSSKILVVIDDVENQEQYESLAGPFAPGSVVIVTTRSKSILDELPIETRYQYRLSQLDEAESWALFNRHARPSHTLKALSEEIIKFASGLPIALEVVGSYLCKQSEETWVAYVEKLHQNPNITIQQQLLIIFEELKWDNPVLMAMFLDIACFFIGWKREEVVRILETCYTFVDDKIDILRRRNLLTINNSNELCMHGLLRDMGREIVRNNYPNEPEKQSRLWQSKDIHDVLQNHKGTHTIEGIFSDQHASEKVSFSAETFKRMSRLRFLYLKNVNLTGSFEQTFEGLRWLCWHWCPLTSLPSDLYFQELVILEMPHSKMRTLWELNMASQVFQELQTLNMKDSEDLVTTPDFNRLPCLITLNLAGCKSLEEVHQSIGNLVSLVSINLCGCVKLRVLPDSICRLSKLQVLRLNGCTRLDDLPAKLGKMKSLIKLHAHGLNISRLPRSVGDLSNLDELIISSNKKLQTLPDTICNLKALRSLDINGCTSLKALPTEFGNITSLRKLNANSLSISKLPDSVGRLTELVKLEIRYNEKLTTLPDTICNLRSLKSLDLKYCHRLMSIPKLPRNLMRIKADGCKTVERLPNLSKLKCMELLVLTDCTGLTELQGLKELSSIKKLHLGGCISSLLADTLTECLFQAYSQFRHESQVYFPAAEFPDWITQSPDWTGHSNNIGSPMSLDLSPNVSHNFLAMILCFKYRDNRTYDLTTYSVKNTTSGFVWNGRFDNNYDEAQIVILPSSIFLVRDGDTRIELTANAEIVGIRLLYKPETSEIEEDRNYHSELQQAYSQFRHESQVYFPAAEFPDWITQSPDWTGHSSNIGSTMSLHLSPNVSHNFLAMILCFKYRDDHAYDLTTYSVKNTTSGFVWNGRFDNNYDEAQIVILPSSIFLVRDGDTRIELTANAEIVGIRLLYKPKITMIDDYDRSHQSEDLEFEKEKSLYHSEDLEIEEEQSYHSADLEIEEVRSYHSEDLGFKPETPSPVFTSYRRIMFTLRKWLNI